MGLAIDEDYGDLEQGLLQLAINTFIGLQSYFKGNLNCITLAEKFSEVELHNSGASAQTSLAAFISFCSVLMKNPVQEQRVVLGNMTLGGVVNPVEDLADSMQLAMDSGATKIL